MLAVCNIMMYEIHDVMMFSKINEIVSCALVLAEDFDDIIRSKANWTFRLE